MINKHQTRRSRLTVILSTALMLFLTPVGYAQGFEFEEFQSIPTTQGATDHYFAANHHDNDSKLYRWNGAYDYTSLLEEV